MYLYFIHILFLNIYRIGKYFYIIYKMSIDIHKVITGNPIYKKVDETMG